jgi:hypothetical protein
LIKDYLNKKCLWLAIDEWRMANGFNLNRPLVKFCTLDENFFSFFLMIDDGTAGAL